MGARVMRLHLTGLLIDAINERRLEHEWSSGEQSTPIGWKDRAGRNRSQFWPDLRQARGVESDDYRRGRTFGWVITAHFDRKATRAARKTDAHDL
jgi:hypothetical protein